MNNKDYFLYEIEVESHNCFVANMDYITSAYVNKAIDPVGRSLIVEYMTSLYDSTSCRLNEYKEGTFRAPEVLIKSKVSPDNIRKIEYTKRLNENIISYNKELKSKLGCVDPIHILSDEKYEKIAIHDDSSGMLITFRNCQSNEFFTIEFCEAESEVIGDFFKK